MKVKIKKKTYLAAAVGWSVLITILSLIPLSGAGAVKSTVLDKAVHVIFYLVFTVLWYNYLQGRAMRNRMFRIFIYSLVYGMILEVLQETMPYGRHFDIKDILANGVGAFLGIILAKLPIISTVVALKRKK